MRPLIVARRRAAVTAAPERKEAPERNSGLPGLPQVYGNADALRAERQRHPGARARGLVTRGERLQHDAAVLAGRLGLLRTADAARICGNLPALKTGHITDGDTQLGRGARNLGLFNRPSALGFLPHWDGHKIYLPQVYGH